MDTNIIWCMAILGVATFNTCSYVRYAFKAKVFRCFGRVALSYSSLVYLSLMAVVPLVCTGALLLIPVDAELLASEMVEAALLTGSAWVSHHTMGWLALGVVTAD
jgi:hypothetical protein